MTRPDVRVLGAGLAGCSVAEAFARRGLRVELVDPGGIGAGASGQREAVFQPRLGGPTERDARLVRLGFAHTRALLLELDPGRELWRDCGVVHLAADDDAAARFERRIETTSQALRDHAGDPDLNVAFFDSRTARDRIGLEDLGHGVLWFPDAGTMQPKRFCESLVARQRSHIELRKHQSGHEVELAVVCTGPSARQLPGLDWIAIRPTRGQATSVRATDLSPLSVVLCNSGYATPSDRGGLVTLAGTYGHGDEDGGLRDDDDRTNIERTRERLAPLGLRPEARAVLSEAGVRATTSDRLPLVGGLPEADTPGLSEALRAKRCSASLGHGSRGTATAPLAGEWLCRFVLDRDGETSDLADWRFRLRPDRRRSTPTTDAERDA